MAPVFFLVCFIPEWTDAFYLGSVVVLWLLFALIEVSDALDGALARKRDEVTALGKLLDPFSDVISRLTYFVCFVALGVMPTWIFIILMYREFGIVFLRLMMVQRNLVLAARLGGKLKAVTYTGCGAAGLLLISATRITAFAGAVPVLTSIVLIVFIAAAVLSVASFADYLLVASKTKA